jgi:hypothetical protein
MKRPFPKFAEALIGRSFTDADRRGARRFDIRHLLGKSCLLSVIHAVGPERTSARVSGAVALPSVRRPGGRVFDHGEMDHLPEWMRKMIAASPEYDEIMNPKPKRTAPLAEVLNDDIPF